MREMTRPDSPEPDEDRIARYLNRADEALKAASVTKQCEAREAHLAIAASWIQLAENVRPAAGPH